MSKLTQLYQQSKSAKVGETCVCPSCKTTFIKSSYQQAFCKTKKGTECKDYYWNNVTPTKRNNTTRISPANARFQASRECYNSVHSVYDGFHPFEGLNDDDYKSY